MQKLITFKAVITEAVVLWMACSVSAVAQTEPGNARKRAAPAAPVAAPAAPAPALSRRRLFASRRPPPPPASSPMEDRKAVNKSADMADDMQADAVECAATVRAWRGWGMGEGGRREDKQETRMWGDERSAIMAA